FCVLPVLLTQGLSNAAAALVVLPIALRSAESLAVSPVSFGVAVMLSASISVLTPFEPSCILVYGPGKYRFADFVKVGSGLVLCSLAIIIVMVPVLWPF
ncbi:MAG TPA: potassium transporter TrkA, partial [Verrucomicrobiales bacterium]|nr:potassium transporter TrkA [Verrucomicrobiales bacterium]